MTDIYNLFKFLEDKKGKEVPFKVKLRFNLNALTDKDINIMRKEGDVVNKGPLKFLLNPFPTTMEDVMDGIFDYGYDAPKNFIVLMDENNNPKKTFDSIGNFRDGFIRVYIKNSGYNFINTAGEFLSPDLWFYYASEFNKGFAWVEIKEDNDIFINTRGELYHKNGKELTPEEVEELKR